MTTKIGGPVPRRARGKLDACPGGFGVLVEPSEPGGKQYLAGLACVGAAEPLLKHIWARQSVPVVWRGKQAGQTFVLLADHDTIAVRARIDDPDLRAKLSERGAVAPLGLVFWHTKTILRGQPAAEAVELRVLGVVGLTDRHDPSPEDVQAAAFIVTVEARRKSGYRASLPAARKYLQALTQLGSKGLDHRQVIIAVHEALRGVEIDRELREIERLNPPYTWTDANGQRRVGPRWPGGG